MITAGVACGHGPDGFGDPGRWNAGRGQGGRPARQVGQPAEAFANAAGLVG
jgi:hypothetical protein